MQSFNTSLSVGGPLSFIAYILRLSIIIAGPQWYRFFGAGEKWRSLEPLRLFSRRAYRQVAIDETRP